MNKLPVVIPYISDGNNGKELRHTLRSLKNLKQWNGEVYVVGDKEPWFKNIHHVPSRRLHGKPHKDVEMKVRAVSPYLPEEYIWVMDDIYITEPTVVKPLHKGRLKGGDKTAHQRFKRNTKEWLEKRGLTELLDYAVHVPIIFNRDKRLEVSNYIVESRIPIQARSLYGNLFKIGGEYYEDKKTKTHELKKGLYLSTQFYTSELDKLFPEKSRFEND